MSSAEWWRYRQQVSNQNVYSLREGNKKSFDRKRERPRQAAYGKLRAASKGRLAGENIWRSSEFNENVKQNEAIPRIKNEVGTSYAFMDVKSKDFRIHRN